MTVAAIGRPGWRRSAGIGLHAAARRTDLWPLALASFLFRGGIVAFLLPVVVLPSTVGVATFVGPTTVTPNGPAPEFVRLTAMIGALVVAWLVGAGLLAATSEAALVRASVGPRRAGRIQAGLALRILRVRSVASLPLVLAVGWSVPRLVGATYDQLIKPSDPGIALPIRVLEAVPAVLGVVVVAWLLCEALGGIAVRRAVLYGEGAFESTARAAVHLVVHPITSAATVVLGFVLTAGLLVPALLAASLAWGRVGVALASGDELAAFLLAVVFVTTWGTALLVAAVGATWRAVAWTAEVVRTRALEPAGAGVLGLDPAVAGVVAVVGVAGALAESEAPSTPS